MSLLDAIGGGVTTLVLAYIGFRVKLESRLKDLEHNKADQSELSKALARLDYLEHEVEFLKPFKDILQLKGLEQVKKVYEEREEEKKQ